MDRPLGINVMRFAGRHDEYYELFAQYGTVCWHIDNGKKLGYSFEDVAKLMVGRDEIEEEIRHYPKFLVVLNRVDCISKLLEIKRRLYRQKSSEAGSEFAAQDAVEALLDYLLWCEATRKHDEANIYRRSAIRVREHGDVQQSSDSDITTGDKQQG